MLIQAQWWSFVESLVNIDRSQPGVYELDDQNGIVVYIGSSDELRPRLTEALPQ